MPYFNKEELAFIDREHIRWFKDRGDSTARLNYNLTTNSVVFDVGGFEGEWSQSIIDRYNPYVYIIEPVHQYYTLLSNKFKNNNKVTVINCGISNNNKNAEFYLHPVSPDGSSEFSNSPGNQLKETVTLRKFTEVINNTVGDKTIDLMKINIEGGEFFAMPDIVESNKIKQITDLQIQFHHDCSNIDNPKEKRNLIHQDLIKTHQISWCYEFVWENWKKNV